MSPKNHTGWAVRAGEVLMNLQWSQATHTGTSNSSDVVGIGFGNLYGEKVFTFMSVSPSQSSLLTLR